MQHLLKLAIPFAAVLFYQLVEAAVRKTVKETIE